jgi:antitoxin HicB
MILSMLTRPCLNELVLRPRRLFGFCGLTGGILRSSTVFKDPGGDEFPPATATPALTDSRISELQGGGFVALVPDLPGCISDGETAEAALASIMDAAEAWIEEAQALGRPVPPPSRHLQAAE